MNKSETQPGIGTPEYFGAYVELLNKNLDLGTSTKVMIHELNSGSRELPTEDELETMITDWQLDPEESDYTRIAAGYLPRVTLDLSTPEAQETLTIALKQMLDDQPRGFQRIKLYFEVGKALLRAYINEATHPPRWQGK